MIRNRKDKKVAVILSYFSLGIHFLSTFLVTPFILNTVGQGEYGLFELINSTVSYLSLLGFGFSASYIRFFSRYSVNNDKEGIYKLNGIFMSLFIAMSIVCLLIGCIIIINIRSIYGTGLNDSEYGKAKILMSILVLNMSLSFPKSIFISHSSAYEEFVFQKLITLLCAIILPIMEIIFLTIGKGAIGLGIATILISFIELISYIWFNFKYLHIKFIFGKFAISEMKEITVFTFFIFLNQLLDILWGSNVDNFLIGRICGTEEVAVYSLGNKFNSILYSLSIPISSLFVPEINRIVATNKNNDGLLTDIFVKVGRYQLIMLMYFFGAFCLWGKFFIRLWIGKNYDNSYFVAIILIGSVLVSLTQNIGIEIQRAKNKHQIRSLVYLCIAIGNILISIPLVFRFGAVGASLGTAIALVLGTIIFMNLYYSKVLGIGVSGYWKMAIRIILKILPCFVMGLIIEIIVIPNTILLIGIQGIIYSIVYFLMIFYRELSDNEKKIFYKYLKFIQKR